MNSSLGPACCA